MELSQFFRIEITKFIDSQVELKTQPPSTIRSEEYGVFNFQKDYENEIKKAMQTGEVVTAKNLYDELLKKFNSKLEKDVAIKLLDLLNKVTIIIKEHIKEYNQEMLLKPEFDRYDEILKQKRNIPEKIEVKTENVNFFNENPSVLPSQIAQPPIEIKQPPRRSTIQQQKPQTAPVKINRPPIPAPRRTPEPQPTFQKQELPNYSSTSDSNNSSAVLQKVNYVESEINKALINQNLARARILYIELKKLFTIFPDEQYDLKTDLFTDLLSSNYRIHQLAEHLNKLKKIQLDRIFYEQKTKELEIIRERKNLLEKQKIDHEIDKIRKDIEIIKDPIVASKKINTEEDFEEKEIESMKNKIKLDRLKQEQSRTLKKDQKSISYEDLKQTILNNEEKVTVTQNEKKDFEMKKNNTIKKLYSEGIKTFFNNEQQKARVCFEKILEINPNYKPALIRLEQIS